jgi:adenosylcobyric acid synthase
MTFSKWRIVAIAALRAGGFDIDIAAHVRRGGQVLGLCGGYQMLGRRLHDPDAIEGPAGSVDGLGLLDVETRLTADKRLVAVTGATADGAAFSGYEMHMGETMGSDCARPFAVLAGDAADGAISADGRIAGTYVHGLFADDRQRAAWLTRFGAAAGGLDYEAGVEETLDRLAAHLEQHVDLDRLIALAE